MIQDSRKRNIRTRNKKVKGLDIIHLPTPYYHPDPPKKIKIVHTMSDVGRSPVSSELEGANRGFTPVNPRAKINITPEKPVASSKSKANAGSSVQVGKSDQVKAKANGVWNAMHDSKAMKSTAKAIQPNQVNANVKDVTKPTAGNKAKANAKAMQPLKKKAKSNPFIMTEAKAPSKHKSRPKVESPSSEPGDESESEDPATSELQMKDITNRNKTTVAKLVQELASRQLPTKGNRGDVTARFMLYELGLDTTGTDEHMHTYCKELLQASMTRLKDTLQVLKQNSVGTNKPELVGRILKATYPEEDDSDDEEDVEDSSSEGEGESDQEISEGSATPSTSPDNVANGKKRARSVVEDSDNEDANHKRQKVDVSDDESKDISCRQPKVEKKKPRIHDITKVDPKTKFEPHGTSGVSKAETPQDDKKKRRRPAEEEDNVELKQKKHGKPEHGNAEVQQAKKVKFIDPQPKPRDKDRTSAAEIGRAVREKSISSTHKPKPKKSKDKEDNHFVFNSLLDSRTLFENTLVPADVLSCALRVLTRMGTVKDINVVHDFRHPLPLFKLYRDGKHRPNAKKCPRVYLLAQEFYQEREEELLMEILEAEKKEDEEKAKEMAEKKEEDDQEMGDGEAKDQDKMAEDEDDEEFDEDKETEDQQPDQEMSDDDEEDTNIDDLIIAAPVDGAMGEDVAEVYQQAEIAAYYEDIQNEQDEADDLRGKSLHASEVAYLASIPEGIAHEPYYDGLWDPESDEEGSKKEKMQFREKEITLMKIKKVEVGSETFKKVRWSHDGKW